MANENSDVKLQHGQVKVEAWDLCVDSKDRRVNNTPHRRALVHDYGDRLTLNWGKDYPKGVKIQGNTEIDGDLQVNGLLKAKVQKLEGWEFLGSPPSIHLVATDLVLVNQPLEESKRNVALSHVKGDKLVINRDKGYEGGVEIEGNTKIDGNIYAKEGRLSKLQLGWDNRLTRNHEPYITIDQNKITAHNVKIGAGTLHRYGHSISQVGDIDLIQEILKMREEIKELKAKVKKLESK
jgi:hypothetical protein